ncbi:transcription factor e(y)2-domain-containing protein [Dipodascopsis tothii]|uniref:transcription factor e(y)2-domain-containing protein n=1 Tax=Dipodascopsis tothii TaxID=44089 RepID=UPI0034CF31EE
MSDTQIRAQVNQKLIESGEYERMSKHLKKRLSEAGWFVEVNALATDNVRRQDTPNFEALVADVEARALELVPDEIKIEILRMIKQFIEGVIAKQ